MLLEHYSEQTIDKTRSYRYTCSPVAQQIQRDKRAFLRCLITPVCPIALIGYAIDGAQPRMRTSVAHKRTRELRTSERACAIHLPLDEGKGRGGEERGDQWRGRQKWNREVERDEIQEGNRLQLFKWKHKIKGKLGARERRAIARLGGGWIRCGPFGLPFGLSLRSLD